MNDPISILLVEDDPHIQNAIKATLSDTGYCIESSKHGKGALRYLVQKKYDLVITDIVNG
jgi:Response regulator containing CheY-like receiver, AAA-type ATPase, and DNA-binding domains